MAGHGGRAGGLGGGMVASRMRGSRVHGVSTRAHGHVLRHGAVGVLSGSDIHRCRVALGTSWCRHGMR